MDGAGIYKREMQEMQRYFSEEKNQISMKTSVACFLPSALCSLYTCSRSVSNEFINY